MRQSFSCQKGDNSKVVLCGQERKGLAGKQTTASEAGARRTCRTCSTSCSNPVGHVCAVSMPRWPKAAMMLPLALLKVLGLRFTPQTIRPSNAPGHTPPDVSMHRCHSNLLTYKLQLIVTRTACRQIPPTQRMPQMHPQSHKSSQSTEELPSVD